MDLFLFSFTNPGTNEALSIDRGNNMILWTLPDPQQTMGNQDEDYANEVSQMIC